MEHISYKILTKNHIKGENGIRLKKYFARMMVTYKEFDRKEELDEDVQDPEAEDLNISNLFELLLDIYVTAEKWDC